MRNDPATRTLAGGLPVRPAFGRRLAVCAGVVMVGLMAWAYALQHRPVVIERSDFAADAAAAAPSQLQVRRAEDDALSVPVVAPARAAPTPLRREFDRTDDLYAYARTLAPEIQAGNAEAMWLMSRVVDYCAAYAGNPAAFDNDSRVLAAMRVPAAATMAAARERVATRCRRFTADEGFSPELARRLRLEAALAGSLVAEAELFGGGEPISLGDDYAGDLIDRVIDSGDPDALNGLAPGMGDGGLGTNMVGIDDSLAPQFRILVWQLAACRLGMDCGPGSALMTAYCVNGGICSRNPVQGFEEFVFDAAIPRQSADLVRSMVDALIAEIGGGP